MADEPDQAAETAKRNGAQGPDELIGRVVNERFKVVALIARGGMGKVYRAEQAPLGRTCALKVLNPKYAGDHDPEFHKRFFLEASISSKLTHPNTVTIFDYGRTDDEIYYMAMEFLEGRTLHRAIRDEGPFNEERTAHIGRQVCRSLREAHSLGVIHRDLKPANVFLVEHADEHDFVKVLDFGLVKNIENKADEDLTKAGLFMGSPKYMAPEQIKGENVDARTDIYALGVILYEMLTGKVPFQRQNSVHVMMAHVNEQPPALRTTNPNIQVSQATEELVMRCLEKDPNDRFSSMEEVLAALKIVGSGAMTATLSGVMSSGDFMAVTNTPFMTSNETGSHPEPSGSGSGSKEFLANSAPSTSGHLVSPQTLESTDALMPENKGSKKLLVAAIAAVAVIAIGGAVMLSGKDKNHQDQPSHASSSATASTATTPSAAATTTGPPAKEAGVQDAGIKTLIVRFDTTPGKASAKAKDGTVLCAKTPCDYEFKELTKEQQSKTRTVTFTRSGYRSSSKTFRATDKLVKVKLVPLRAAPRHTGKPKNTAPTGFKDIPY